jgi:hypothetical protein
VAALIVSLAMIPISAAGLDLATIATGLPLPAVAAIWSTLLFIPLSIGLEARRRSPEWRAWAERANQATLWQMIALRHLPDAPPGVD